MTMTRSLPQAQRGAALIVGLVLLLVMTLLGVAAMRTSTLQLVMAGNSQYSQLAFQAAESGVENEFNAGGLTTTLDRDSTYDLGDGTEAETHIEYSTSTAVPAGGYSIGAGFMAHHFEIRSIGTAPRSATSIHRQGLYIVGPG
jgi:type IV pilus assembly protein PilX